MTSRMVSGADAAGHSPTLLLRRADAYWADENPCTGRQDYATITDDRAGRASAPAACRRRYPDRDPDNKLKWTNESTATASCS